MRKLLKDEYGLDENLKKLPEEKKKVKRRGNDESSFHESDIKSDFNENDFKFINFNNHNLTL